MRAILLAVMGGAVMALGACQSTGTPTADASGTREVEVGGGQSRYTVEVNQPVPSDVTTTTTEQPYSLSGERVPPRVDLPAYIRQATNGGN